MKIIGFLSIHYGVEYLRECLSSIVNHVDMVVVAYSKKPSHSFGTNMECPDSEEAIKVICYEILGDKLIWDRAERYTNEASHRNVRYKYSNDYDLILTVDADEVLKEYDIQPALEYAMNGGERYYGIDGYVNFWRSFDFVCYDGFRPIRIENLHRNNNLQNLNCKLTIYHFSTCQSESLMRYKYKVFGHAPEMRLNWLDNIYYSWTPENQIQDVHPVALNLWNAVSFDKNILPDYLKLHPNFNKTLI